MKLISLVGYGMGDWYEPFCMLPSFIHDNDITEHDLYIDSVYFLDESKYVFERSMGRELIRKLKENTIVTNIYFVGREFFGSGDYYGLEDRVKGPDYVAMKNIFLPYRTESLRSFFINDVFTKEKEPYRFVSWCNRHNYEWVGDENVAVKSSYVHSLCSWGEKIAVVHIRLRGRTVDRAYYNFIIQCLLDNGYTVELIGSDNELTIDVKHEKVLDYRGVIGCRDVLSKIESADLFIGNNSMYTCHAISSKVPTIACTMESNGCKESFFTDRQLAANRVWFFNSDVPHIEEIRAVIEKESNGVE